MESMEIKKEVSIKVEAANPKYPPESAKVAAPAAIEEQRVRRLDDISDAEIQRSIAEVLFASHHTGGQGEAIIKALQEAITGRDSAANCAEKYDIQLSTLHVYMAQVKINLGVTSHEDIFKNIGLGKKRPLATDETEITSPEKKKKRYTKSPGRTFVAPEHWLQDEAKLRETVWSIVSKCKYARHEKKLRLNQAIMDILTTNKPTRAAAADQNLPSSTVISYFRRCRAEAEKILGPGEGADAQSPSTENAAAESELSNDEEDGIPLKQEVEERRKVTPVARFRKQTTQFPVLARETTPNQIGSSDAMAQLGAAFISSPIVQQCLALQALMNNSGGGDHLMNLMNESLKTIFGQAMPNSPNVNISDTPAAPPPPTPISAINKADLHQSTTLHPVPAIVEPAPDLFPADIEIPHEPAVKVTPEDFHNQAVIFDHLQLAQKFVYYFVDRARNQDAIQEDLRTLMKHITSAFPAFLYKIRPQKSDVTAFKNSHKENKLLYDRWMSKLPKTLAELVTDEILGFIVEYLKPFAHVNMVIDADFTKFLILHVINNRSFEELYDENEYQAMHQKILSSL